MLINKAKEMRMEKRTGSISTLFFKTTLAFFATFALLISSAMADPPDPNCQGNPDPFDTTCPLDTWVYLLVFLALTAGIWYIRKNKKSLFA